MSAHKPTNTDAWVDALAGRTPSAPLSAADLAVARGLREAVLKRQADLERESVDSSDAAELAARDVRRDAFLAEHGIVPSSDLADQAASTTSPMQVRSQPKLGIFAKWLPASNQAWFALAAGLAAIALVVPLAVLFESFDSERPAEDGVRGMRGSAVGGGKLLAADASQKAGEIDAALLALGAATRRYQRDGQEMIDAKIPTDRIAAARETLRAFGITVPDNGIVVITVRSK